MPIILLCLLSSRDNPPDVVSGRHRRRRRLRRLKPKTVVKLTILTFKTGCKRAMFMYRIIKRSQSQLTLTYVSIFVRFQQKTRNLSVCKKNSAGAAVCCFIALSAQVRTQTVCVHVHQRVSMRSWLAERYASTRPGGWAAACTGQLEFRVFLAASTDAAVNPATTTSRCYSDRKHAAVVRTSTSPLRRTPANIRKNILHPETMVVLEKHYANDCIMSISI